MHRLILTLFLVALPLVAWAQEKVVSLAHDDATVETVAAEVARQAGIEVTVAEAIRGKKISLFLNSAPAEVALTLIASLADGKVVDRGEGRFHIDYVPPKPEWLRRLEINVNGEFPVLLPKRSLTLGAALGLLGRASEAEILLDPVLLWKTDVLEHPVTLPPETLSTVQLLDGITGQAGLAWDLRWGLVFVARPERLAALSKSDGQPTDYDALAGWEKSAHRYLNAGMSFCFEKVPLPDALAAALRGTDFELEIPKTIREDLQNLRVNLAGRNLAKRQILTALLVPRGFGFELTERGVEVRPR